MSAISSPGKRPFEGLKIVFAGASSFALPTLAALLEAGATPIAVYTRPPRRAGRGMTMQDDIVASFARSHELPLRRPTSLHDEAERPPFAAADFAVIVSYGALLPESLFSAPRLGTVNLHPSSLPQGRGAAPIERAIMAGETHFGLSVMRIAAQLDSGPILSQSGVALPPDIDAAEARRRLAQRGAELTIETLIAWIAGRIVETPQKHENATYAPRIAAAERRLDWRCSAQSLHDRIRALSPDPGAWCLIEKNKGETTQKGQGDKTRDKTDDKTMRIRVLKARPRPLPDDRRNDPVGTLRLHDGVHVRCGQGMLELQRLQKAGGRPLDAAAFFRGLRAHGARLS